MFHYSTNESQIKSYFPPKNSSKACFFIRSYVYLDLTVFMGLSIVAT